MPPTSTSNPPRQLPSVPAKHNEFLSYIEKHPQTPMVELLQPYKAYDNVLREIFAQEPTHEAVQDNLINVLPVYSNEGTTSAKIRARDIANEPDHVKGSYIMPLTDEQRKPNGSSALVENFKEFQTNFNVFSESSLVDMDWSNVVAAGSSVVTSLLPVPEKYKSSKRGLRSFYHEILAPASDVDLFLYGLTEEQAVEKIKQIERCVRDAILDETTTIRTKNAITIASRYPTRHVQIVLRIYKSISEILTGFDVDCSCAAYDGKQVYVSPRALASYTTQINQVDPSRRSPSYENRLSKYSHRGFEVYYPDLDRSRIDPTIFERSFGRTVGLARLLILEKLPKSTDRDAYIDQRRQERGRPAINRWNRYAVYGNIKEDHGDEVAEWVEQDEVSNYHTFTVPYGEKFHAKKIEKLLYTKDLLLNAEWNKPKDREVHLHRHPAFFGHAEDVLDDCCGYCPKPSTIEEEDVAEEENKIYVSGRIEFMKDDPGRQAIGSFNPITETDWTEMAYVGNTARLCQAIVDNDVEHVQDWLKQEDSDPNRRDIAGRTPLHLACMVSTPAVVQVLVDHGARMVARLADGRTALHIAAARGSVEIVKILLLKSEENAEEEAQKEDRRHEAKVKAKQEALDPDNEMKEDQDWEELDDEDDSDEASQTTASFVKVKSKDETDNIPDDENVDDPDIFDVNVLTWDSKASPLHLAIIHGQVEVVEELAGSFGADVLLPIKLINEYDRSPRAAILTLVLSLALPLEKAAKMVAKLLELGASSAQADMNQQTCLHHYATRQPEILQLLFDQDSPAVKRAVNHLAVTGSIWRPAAYSALMTAIAAKNPLGALKLLAVGAHPSVDFDEYIKSTMLKYPSTANQTHETNLQRFQDTVEQPIINAVNVELPDIALELLSRGVDPNTLSKNNYNILRHNYRYNHEESVLDIVHKKIKQLKEYNDELPSLSPHGPYPKDEDHLAGLQKGTYRYWTAKRMLRNARDAHDNRIKRNDELVKNWENRKGVAEKAAAIHELLEQYEKLEAELIKKGAKTFDALYPNLPKRSETQSGHHRGRQSEEDKPFEVKYGFMTPDLNEVRREGYADLFDAACAGNLDKIKELTLTPWGNDKKNPPLKIAIKDDLGYSVLSLAALNGHLDVAKAIMEIARAQYQPKESETTERFDMDPGYDSEADTGDDDDDVVQVYSHLIDDNFTIDLVQEVSEQVKSDVAPVAMLQWIFPTRPFLEQICGADGGFPVPETKPKWIERSLDLVEFAIWTDNLKLLNRIIELANEFTLKPKETEVRKFSIVSEGAFRFAIQLGRTHLLPELIKCSGVGIPIDVLVKKSGVQATEKPKYYQGLTVHGKKRADWATAGRNMGTRPQHKDPPLLLAAFDATIESVEFFMSPTPLRHYNEFAQENKDDKRLQRLAQAEGGIDKAISNWLDSRSNLVLHCAVMAKPSPESARLVSHLLKTVPETLETKSVDGYTPLALAYALHRGDIAKILVEAGANQTVRDHQGRNLLHLLLAGVSGSSGIWAYTKDFPVLLDLLDSRLVPSLLTERCLIAPGSLTPLALWLRLCANHGFSRRILNRLLDFSASTNHAELDMLDGSGNSPVHHAVKEKNGVILQTLLARRPDLLSRENATGSTPVELAQDAWTAKIVRDAPPLPHHDGHNYYWHSHSSNFHTDIVNRNTESFLEAAKSPAKGDEKEREIYDICLAIAEANPRKRKFVSLVEANEVAKRIAGSKSGSRYPIRSRRYDRSARDERDGDKEGEDRSDEVSKWHSAHDSRKEMEEVEEIRDVPMR